MGAKVKCIIKRPDEEYGHVTNISVTLKNLQNIVGGPIECVPCGGRKSLDRQKIMDYFDKGRTEEQIAELVGCHRQTVRRILKETGKLDEAKLDTGKVMALHKAGWSVNSIAGEMGCSSQCIEKTLQEKDMENESEML